MGTYISYIVQGHMFIKRLLTVYKVKGKNSKIKNTQTNIVLSLIYFNNSVVI